MISICQYFPVYWQVELMVVSWYLGIFVEENASNNGIVIQAVDSPYKSQKSCQLLMLHLTHRQIGFPLLLLFCNPHCHWNPSSPLTGA
jgi:hypothetical protein